MTLRQEAVLVLNGLLDCIRSRTSFTRWMEPLASKTA